MQRRNFQHCVIALFLAVSTLAGLLPAEVAAAREEIRFAPQPLISEPIVKQQYAPFTGFLEEISGTPVQQVYYSDYQTLIKAMADDQIDIAHLGPLPYVMLMRNGLDFKPIVRFLNASGKTTYTCSLIHFDDNADPDKINAEQTIALAQPYSTCSYLMTERMLKQQQQQLHDLDYYYAGNHAEAILDVVRGKATFAGVKTSIAQQYLHLGIRIKENSVELPGFLLVANPRTLSQKTIEKIRSRLLSVHPMARGGDHRLVSTWPQAMRNGAIEVKNEDYDLIKQLLMTISIPGVNR